MNGVKMKYQDFIALTSRKNLVVTKIAIRAVESPQLVSSPGSSTTWAIDEAQP